MKNRQPDRRFAAARARFVAHATVAVVVVLVAGCSSTRFNVDGIKNKGAGEEAVAYAIRSANPQVKETSPQFQRVAELVKTSLSSKGCYEAPTGAPVDMTVEVDYGIEPPKTKVYAFPAMRAPAAPGGSGSVSNPDGSPGGRSMEAIRDVEVRKTITTFSKHLRITARESAERARDHPPREIWSVLVTNEDQNGDLDAYLPLLIAAAMDKVNEDTHGEIQVVLKPQDERVKFVQQGM